ncbi:MAG: MFS transporter [Desulfuromonadaceae bacterium]|nr:MFS transporter [Desulfuromonadaceae bacterium]
MSEVVAYSRFRWFVLLVQCMATSSSVVVMIAPASLIGVLARDLGVSVGVATGSLMGSFNLVMALSSLVGGAVCDRYGVIKAYAGSLLLLGTPFLALPWVGHSFACVVALRLIQGLGVGCILSSVVVIATSWFPPEQRGIVTGFQGMSSTLGLAVGFMAAPAALASTGTWQGALALLSVGCLVALVLVLAMLAGPGPAVAPCTAEEFEDGAFSRACRQPVTWLVVAIMFSFAWVYAAFNDLTPGYLAIAPPVGIGLGPQLGGKLMMMVQFAAMTGSVTSGYVIEKVFRGSTRPVIMIGYLLFGAATLSLVFPIVHTRMPGLAGCLVAAGFFEAWVIPGALAFYSVHYPAHIAGRLAGLSFGIGGFGGTLGVIVGAFALHHTGNYHVSIFIVGAAALTGLVLAAGLRAPASPLCELMPALGEGDDQGSGGDAGGIAVPIKAE